MERYVLSDGSGRYRYDVDMSDSLAVYDLTLYARVDDGGRTKAFPLNVSLVSPSGAMETETVWFDYARSEVSPYRTDCSPQERGIWRITVTTDTPSLEGLGLICTRRHGTR